MTGLDYKRLTQFMKLVGLMLLFTLATASNTFAQDPYQRQVRKFEMPELGIPNLAGLAFSPAANAFLVAPGADKAEIRVLPDAERMFSSVTVAKAWNSTLTTAIYT